MAFAQRYTTKVRELLRLALPVMLAQLGYIAVQVADTAMVGKYGGEEAIHLASVAFGTSISWLFFFVCIGLTIGLTPVIGELFVQERKQEMAHYLQTSLSLYPLFGVAYATYVPTFVASVVPDHSTALLLLQYTPKIGLPVY